MNGPVTSTRAHERLGHAGTGWMSMGSAPIFAHQGGWDEILMVVAPLAIIGGLLWLANRRVSAQIDSELRAGTSGSAKVDGTVDDAVGHTVDRADERRRSSGDDGQD